VTLGMYDLESCSLESLLFTCYLTSVTTGLETASVTDLAGLSSFFIALEFCYIKIA
jgi:hypothetical protein